MNKILKVGDLVETCSLMPGVVMKREGNEIEVRSLEYDNQSYNGESYSCCSIGHCGIVLLTPQQVLTRLQLGKEKLREMWNSVTEINDYYKLLEEDDPIYAE